MPHRRVSPSESSRSPTPEVPGHPTQTPPNRSITDPSAVTSPPVAGRRSQPPSPAGWSFTGRRLEAITNREVHSGGGPPRAPAPAWNLSPSASVTPTAAASRARRARVRNRRAWWVPGTSSAPGIVTTLHSSWYAFSTASGGAFAGTSGQGVCRRLRRGPRRPSLLPGHFDPIGRIASSSRGRDRGDRGQDGTIPSRCRPAISSGCWARNGRQIRRARRLRPEVGPGHPPSRGAPRPALTPPRSPLPPPMSPLGRRRAG